jgi:hypothetical protein
VKFEIQKIDHKTAKEWVEKWHYSHRMPTGKNISFGVFADENLYAVIVYGIGVNPYQAKFLKVNKVLEIKRMCRSEPPLYEYPLSKFISQTIKIVTKEFPCECIVAFADPEQGHEGTVYKASNFKLHGVTNPEWHLIDANGEKRHRRYAFRHSKRNGVSLAESRNLLGVQRIKTEPKYRWVRYLKNVKKV